MRIILVGWGVVGQSFAKIIVHRKKELAKKYGFRPRIVAIVDKQGAVINPKGLDLEKMLALKKEKGTYISLQYTKGMENDPGPDWCFNPKINHNNIEQTLAATQACDYVVSVQSYLVHICGSLGKECHAIKPPPIYGEVGTDDSTNNRLKWYYGVNKRSPWKMPWWKSVKCYSSWNDWQRCR